MATAVAKLVFVDSNVLVFANVAEAPLHHQAVARLREQQSGGADLWISSQILREYLAVRSREQTFQKPSPPSVLAERVRYFRTAFRVAYETPATVDNLLMLMQKVAVGGKQVHDANVVATMLSHNIRHLLTDNVDDFKRFSAFITVIPLVEQPSRKRASETLE